MKTTSWQAPSTSAVTEPDVIGISQNLILSVEGDPQLIEGHALSVLYLAIFALRRNKRIRITTLDGVELLQNHDGPIHGTGQMFEALLVFEQALIRERKIAIEDTLQDMASYINADEQSAAQTESSQTFDPEPPQPSSAATQAPDSDDEQPAELPAVPGLLRPKRNRQGNGQNRNQNTRKTQD